MASPARFTFDLDFGQPVRRAPVATMPEDLVAQLVRQARDEGFAEGLKQGETNATAMAAQTIASAAAALATRTVEASAALDDARTAHQVEAVELATVIARKLAGHLLARFPLVEIEALIGECMASLDGVPHLVIRCHESLADVVRELATENMTTSGFSGRLIVMGEPDRPLGDCRLEWVDGGLVRDINAISREIDVKISAYLAARGARRNEETLP